MPSENRMKNTPTIDSQSAVGTYSLLVTVIVTWPIFIDLFDWHSMRLNLTKFNRKNLNNKYIK